MSLLQKSNCIKSNVREEYNIICVLLISKNPPVTTKQSLPFPFELIHL